MKIRLIFLFLILFACEINNESNEISFSRKELILNDIYLGYDAEGKAMPFKISIDKNNDTTKIFYFDNFYDISFPENNKSTCYINDVSVNSAIPFKISIYDLIKNTDVTLIKKMNDRKLFLSKYPKEQQIFIFDLIRANDAIITSEKRQKKLENILNDTKSINNWKFILKEKKIDALFGTSSWIDFLCEGFSFRYKIHSLVDDVFNQNMDDETHLQSINFEKNIYQNFETGKLYTISGEILKDEYGFGIALDNPISLQIDKINPWKNLELETDLEGIKTEREAEASLNFPEELIGNWSCNCGYEGIDEADNPPSFYIKETTEGYEIWYARTEGIVKEIKHTDNSYIVKYEDDDEGQIIIELKLKNNRLNINGLTCESSGMERCSLDEKIKVLSH